MYCNTCGSQIPDTAKFCQDCGSVIAKANTKTPTPLPKQTEKKQFTDLSPAFISAFKVYNVIFFILMAITWIYEVFLIYGWTGDTTITYLAFFAPPVTVLIWPLYVKLISPNWFPILWTYTLVGLWLWMALKVNDAEDQTP